MNAEWIDHLNVRIPAGRVDEPREAVRERLDESAASIVDIVDERLGATGAFPSVYFEDPFGYLVELKSPTIEA